MLDLKPAIENVADILMVPEDRAFSPNELSRLVFDPFPARLTIAVDGHLVSSDGFDGRDGILERQRVDLWTALEALEGRWVWPDLVTAMVAPAPEDQQPEIDPVSFASLPRRYATPPGTTDVADALREALVPREVLIVRWRPRTPTGPDFEDTDPRRYLDDVARELIALTKPPSMSSLDHGRMGFVTTDPKSLRDPLNLEAGVRPPVDRGVASGRGEGDRHGWPRPAGVGGGTRRRCRSPLYRDRCRRGPDLARPEAVHPRFTAAGQRHRRVGDLPTRGSPRHRRHGEARRRGNGRRGDGTLDRL